MDLQGSPMISKDFQESVRIWQNLQCFKGSSRILFSMMSKDQEVKIGAIMNSKSTVQFLLLISEKYKLTYVKHSTSIFPQKKIETLISILFHRWG